MNSNQLNILNTIIYSVPATLIAIVLHEYAHALVSYLCGDKGVRAEGRLSLNPLKHLDPVGTICLVLFHFGWAKPVMVNTRNYKHKKLDFCLVALAGPIMNFLVAFISLIFYYVTYCAVNGFASYLNMLFFYIAVINVGLGVFNLIPIPPLDGSNVLMTFLPYSWNQKINSVRRYLPIFLIIVVVTGAMSNILSVLNTTVINSMWRFVVRMFGFTVTSGTTI